MATFYIGTYTSGKSRGIYRANLDIGSGAIDDLQLVAELDNPSFLALHPNLPYLYACSEIRRDGKRQGACLVAFRIESDGSLTQLGSQPTGGQGPCYVSVDANGALALVAHYASGSVVTLPIAADGQLKPVSRLNQHAGHGPRADRQEGPHAHCIVPAPGNRFACAVDLGLDQVLVYALNDLEGVISDTPVSIYQAPAGSGPRHLVFSPGGDIAFLIHELDNTLAALSWDGTQGLLSELDTVSTLPADFSGVSTTAEVLVDVNDRYVYGSNRGHDSLVVFEFDAIDNSLECLQHISSGGKTPRNFRLSPNERFLLAANQDSDSIVCFEINPATGLLKPTGHSIDVGNPSCIKFRT